MTLLFTQCSFRNRNIMENTHNKNVVLKFINNSYIKNKGTPEHVGMLFEFRKWFWFSRPNPYSYTSATTCAPWPLYGQLHPFLFRNSKEVTHHWVLTGNVCTPKNACLDIRLVQILSPSYIAATVAAMMEAARIRIISDCWPLSVPTGRITTWNIALYHICYKQGGGHCRKVNSLNQ